MTAPLLVAEGRRKEKKKKSPSSYLPPLFPSPRMNLPWARCVNRYQDRNKTGTAGVHREKREAIKLEPKLVPE